LKEYFIFQSVLRAGRNPSQERTWSPALSFSAAGPARPDSRNKNVFADGRQVVAVFTPDVAGRRIEERVGIVQRIEDRGDAAELVADILRAVDLRLSLPEARIQIDSVQRGVVIVPAQAVGYVFQHGARAILLKPVRSLRKGGRKCSTAKQQRGNNPSGKHSIDSTNFRYAGKYRNRSGSS
jgi:hypothetical protein